MSAEDRRVRGSQVSFLEGDPDRPIVTGRVYNGFKHAPYPDNPTQSGIKSRSTHGGSPDNFNEIRFEDKKGKEDLLISAERSQTTLVKGSQSISVGGERSLSVTGNDTQMFKAERFVVVTAKDEEHFDNTRTTIVGTRDFTDVDGTKEDKVKGKYLIGVTGPYTLTSTEEILAKQGNNRMRLQGGSAALTNSEALVTMDGPVMELSADSKVTIKVGGTQIVVQAGQVEVKSAAIKLSGNDITIEGKTSVSISGGGSTVDLKPGSATVTSAVVKLNA